MCIYVHIGLPKTATTSLQQSIFEEGDGKYWNYLGVKQPRDSKQRREYQTFIKIISGEDSVSPEDLFPDSNLPILISEEMITVDTCKNPWQSKLENLSRVLKGCDARLLLTVRRPERAAFSLYVERYNRVKVNYPDFDCFCIRSNQARIYDYKYLIEYVDKTFGKDKLSILAFESIKSGEYINGIAQWLGVDPLEFAIPHSNTKRTSVGHVKTHSPTLAQYLEPSIGGGGRYTLRGALRFVLRCCGSHAIRIPWAATVIKLPEFQKYSAFYQKSNQWLFRRTGINYL